MLTADYIALYKVVVLGDKAVGKTSIATRISHDKFNPAYCPTCGVDFHSKNMDTEEGTVRLQLWDTAGQGRYRNNFPVIIKDSRIVIITYDVTSRQTFQNTSYWIEMMRRERGSDVPTILVGNKTDLVDKREVSTEEGEAKARDLNVFFIEFSAKDGLNINALVRKIVDVFPLIKRLSSATKADVNLKSSGGPSSPML